MSCKAQRRQANARAHARHDYVHHDCTVERSWVSISYVLSLETGEMRETSRQHVTGRCGVPLFSAEEKISGVCRSCLNGWEHPDNRTTEKGRAQIANALKVMP